MPSPEFEAALQHFPKDIAVPGDDFQTVRAKFEPAHGHDPGDDVSVEEALFEGVKGLWVTPKTCADTKRSVFFLHGGAFVSCPAATYTFYAAWIARAAEARVLVVDYPLAPESHFPAQLDACVATYRGLLDAGVDAGDIGFAGDSCGGGMIVTTLLRLRDAGLPLPACAVSISGWMDLEMQGDSVENPVGRDPFIDPEWIRSRTRDYLGPEGDPRDPLASPIHADLTGLPPLYLQYGQNDRCRSGAVRLADRAGRDGVDVTLEIWPGMVHGFQGMNGVTPEAADAIARIGSYLVRHLHAR
ncbi:MAG: alpha/beta hydrolase [Deltaproteobacteria bacterium]|nr:alpha/beta hydrolase [Deltaproteobacteria bacterium]